MKHRAASLRQQSYLFFHTKRYGTFLRLTGASNAGGMKKSRFSTNISLYLGNDTRYNGGLMVMWSIEWRQFRQPWTTHDPYFKVTPLFNALKNGTRCGHLHSILKRVISNDLEWPRFLLCSYWHFSVYKNLAIANRSHVSCAHNTSMASIGLITPWPLNLG